MQDALIVGDDQHAHVGSLGDGVDAGGDRVERVDVEPRVGLVEHGQARVEQRELEDLHALLLAAGEAVVEIAVGELARDVGQLHRRLDRLAEVLQRDLVLAARLAGRVHDHAQVLGDGHARDGDRVLEGHEEAGAGALVRIGLRDVLAVEEDLAVGHLEIGVAHDRVRERRLPGAVRPHQCVELAAADVQVHALEDLLVPGGDVQVLDLEVSHESPGSSRWVRRSRRALAGWCAGAT